MKYATRKTNLTKDPDIFEISEGTIHCSNEKHEIADINTIRCNKRFDGFIFAKIKANTGNFDVSSHSAQGFGRAVHNQKDELRNWLSVLANAVNNETKFIVGSSVWKTVGIIVVVVAVIGIAAIIFTVVTGNSIPNNVRWGKVMAAPIMLIIGYRMIKNGGAKMVDKNGFLQYLKSL